MPITTPTNRWTYTGDGVTVAFAYTNKILATSDLKVYLVLIASPYTETLQTETTDYSVSGAGVDAGGTVTFATAPPATHNVVIARRLPNTQPANFDPRKDLPAAGLTAAFDRLEIQIQQNADDIARALRLGDSDPTSGLDALPSAAERASMFLAFDADGQPIATAGGDADVPIAAAMIPVVQAASLAAALTALGAAAAATTITAGAGLTGGGSLAANRSVAVGAGTGILANADDVAVDKASQANMEAATANKVVTADVQHFHPAEAKCWGYVTYSAGTPTLVASYNLTSIADTATGRLTATIANDFSGTSYALLATAGEAAAAQLPLAYERTASRAAGAFEIDVWSVATAALADPVDVSFAAFGDL